MLYEHTDEEMSLLCSKYCWSILARMKFDQRRPISSPVDSKLVVKRIIALEGDTVRPLIDATLRLS